MSMMLSKASLKKQLSVLPPFNPYLTILEAKRAFNHIHAKDIGEVEPCMSNETLAQCFGEAVVAWNANRELSGQE